MIVHEFDLSSPPGPQAGRDQPVPVAEQLSRGAGPAGGISRAIILLALGLLGVASGAVLASAPSGHSQPTPLSATLTVRDVQSDGDRPLIVLRLRVENPGGAAPVLTRLDLDGAGTPAIPLPEATITGDQAVVDVRLRPGCAQQRPGQQQPLRARVVTPGTPGGVRVLLAGALSGPNGLCGLASAVLPEGWPRALGVQDPRTDGPDLVLTVPGMAGMEVSGALPVDGVLNTSAQIGDRLLPAILTNGTVLRILGPPPCTAGTTGRDGAALPMNARLLVRGDTALEQVVIKAGPALARWLVADCPDHG